MRSAKRKLSGEEVVVEPTPVSVVSGQRFFIFPSGQRSCRAKRNHHSFADRQSISRSNLAVIWSVQYVAQTVQNGDVNLESDSHRVVKKNERDRLVAHLSHQDKRLRQVTRAGVRENQEKRR